MLEEAHKGAPRSRSGCARHRDGTRQQLAGLRLIVVGERKRAELVKDGVANVVGYALGGHFRPAPQHKVDQSFTHGQEQQAEQRRQEDVHILLDDAGVDDPADGLRDDDGEAIGNHGEQVDAEGDASVFFEEGNTAQEGTGGRGFGSD